MNKIFCIGYHKTATSSLGAALEYLGYRVKSFEIVESRVKAKEKCKKYAEKYDVLQDMPWPVFFKYLDKEYSDAKFILTVRDEEEWIESVKGYFGGNENRMHEWIYGYGDPIGNEEKYLENYRSHNAKVKRHFKGRFGEDIIIMDITDGDGWEKICQLLGIEMPLLPFPNMTVSYEKEKNMALTEWFSWRLYQVPTKVVKHYRQGRFFEQLSRSLKDGTILRLLRNGILKIFGGR